MDQPKKVKFPLELDEENVCRKEENPPTSNEILHEIGEFGPYQVLVGLVIGFVLTVGSMLTMNFIFSVDIIEHRCWISECESINSNDFNADWLKHAIPHGDGHLDPCNRFEYIHLADSTCSKENFNRSRKVGCDGFILKNNKQRLLSHLNMMCTGQNSELTLLGTASTVGRTIGMPISGLLSDKYGRLITITASTVLGAIFSVLQALPSNLMSFELYVTFEFLASLLSTGMIGAGFVFGMEWTTAQYRVRMVNISMFLDIILPFAAISLAAWYFADNFIAYRLSMAIPGFLMIAFHFILSESPQWLLAQNKHDQAIKSFSNAAKINRRSLQPQTIQRIEHMSAMSAETAANDEEPIKVSIADLLRQKTLAIRLFVTSLIWMCVHFAYYGVFFVSTKVHDNKYLSFALIGFADMPGIIINELLLNRIGRRLTVGLTMVVYSVMLTASTQLSAGQEIVQLILFCVGKAAVTAACTGYHTFSTEFWPTSIRNTASNIGTSAGRAGSILASVTVLLADYHAHLPIFLNVAAGILGAALIFAFLPETMHCEKLPDSMEEALEIGRSTKEKTDN